MLKKRIITLFLTLVLLSLGLILDELHLMKVIEFSTTAAVTMLDATAVFVLGGCMLQTFGHTALARALSFAIFFVLCVCLLYSVHVLEYVVFALCMVLLLYRTVRMCDTECTI